MYFPFDNDFDDSSCNIANGDVDNALLLPGKINNAAYLNGYAHIEVAFMQNRLHGVDQRELTVALWFRYTPRFRYYGYQGLINNGDCVAPPTFDIHIDVARKGVTLSAGINDNLDAFNDIPVSTLYLQFNLLSSFLLE